MAYHVLGREPHQCLGELHERLAGVVAEGQGPDPLQELAVAVGEHQVVQAELGVEVGVQGRLAQVDAVGKVPERDHGQAVAMGQRPGLGEDRGQLRLPAAPPWIDLLSLGHLHGSLRFLSLIDNLSLIVPARPEACQVP